MSTTRAILCLLLGRRLPTTAGTLRIPGITGRVTIRRDRWGIPVIEGESGPDAWFGLGFSHAQDRAAQLDFYRRACRGTLSELVGKQGLTIDRQSRRVGFFRAAQAQLPALAKDVRETVEAYVRGVNAGLAHGLPRKPHEFAILGGEPARWEPADVIAYIKLQSFLISSNWDMELARLQILLLDGPDAVQALDPASANNGPLIDSRDEAGAPKELSWMAAERLAADLHLFRQSLPARAGSNSWVLAGSRTKSGRPILANDPHVAPTLPPPWYLAHVRTPGWAVCGATAAGCPGFAAGHNGTAAWGSTAGLIDNTDLFVEEIGPDGHSIRDGDNWVACQVIDERIRVKGGDEVVEKVLITPRGPIVSPALEGITTALSMRAVWLDPLPTRGLIDVHEAKSFDQFRSTFREWPVTPQHFTYADTSGQIGWQLAGQAPIRKKGWGMVPLSGADPAAGWSGLVPFEEMPHAADPPTGFIVTANNPPVPEGVGPYLGYDWVNGYRAGAITDTLEPRRDWDVLGCQRLQLLRKSKPWEELKELVLSVPAADPDSRCGLDLLRSWNGHVEGDSPAAAVYEFFLCTLAERVAMAKAPKSWEWALGKGFGGLMPHTLFADRRFGHLVKLLHEQPSGWFDQPWADVIADALGEGVRRLGKASGKPADQTPWGELRPLTFQHLVFGEVPVLNRAFRLGPIPGGGDSNTPFQSTVQPLDPLTPPAYMPNLRVVIDVGEWSNSRFVLAGGQSGNPLSPHYGDLFELWKAGDGVPIPWTPAEIAAATVETLVLEPT